MRILSLVAMMLLTACGGPLVNRDASVPLETADYVDTERYLGKWCEIARFPNRFEKNCEGVTAEYARRDGALNDLKAMGYNADALYWTDH